jgi:hypothetical protein
VGVSAQRQVGLAPGTRRIAPVDVRTATRPVERADRQVFLNQPVAGWNIGAGLGLLLFGSLALLRTMISPTVPAGVKLLILAATLPVPLFFLLRLARGGVVCDRQGVLIRNPVRHVRLRWDEIDHFGLGAGIDKRVRAYTTDGSSVHVYGLVRRMSRGAEAEAEPVIAVLNRRLRWARALG